MANRMIEKYNLAILEQQDIEMSIAATIVGVTIEDNTLKVLVDHETSPLRTRKRPFYIVRPGKIIPDEALKFVGQFALDDSPAFLYTDTDDTPSTFTPDMPLATYSDVHSMNEVIKALSYRIDALQAAVTSLSAK